jgi:hypothetical protein
VTTAFDNSLIICAGATDSDEFHSDPIPGAGYTMLDLQTCCDDDKTAVSYRIVPTAGTYSCTMMEPDEPDWAAIGAVFKPGS